MTTATFHDPNCTGCPRCSALAAAIMRNPTNPVLSEAMGNPRLRAMAEAELRTAASTAGGDSDQDQLNAMHDSLAAHGAWCAPAPPDPEQVTRTPNQQILDAAHDRVVGQGAACPNKSSQSIAASGRPAPEAPDPYERLTERHAAVAEVVAEVSALRTANGVAIRPAPDSYEIALTKRRFDAANPVARTAEIAKDDTPLPGTAASFGIPDPYSRENINKHQAARGKR